MTQQVFRAEGTHMRTVIQKSSLLCFIPLGHAQKVGSLDPFYEGKAEGRAGWFRPDEMVL